MELYKLGLVVLQQLSHHNGIREVSIDVFFGPGEGNVVDHIVDLLQLLLLHSNIIIKLTHFLSPYSHLTLSSLFISSQCADQLESIIIILAIVVIIVIMKSKPKANKTITSLFSEENKQEEWEEQTGPKPHTQPKHKQNGFAKYSFFSELFLNIMMNGLKQPTAVQRKTLPLVMEGKDVVVCYKTGSGKTLSYLLPIINKLQAHSQIVGARALILIPTRDLADQITKVLKNFLHKIDLRYSLILGGHTFEGQFQSLSINPDIIIATPGRLLQLLNETELKLTRVQTIVFDEADQLFGEHNFQKELKEVLSKCPTSQRLMFSATITPDLNEFALAGLRDYSYVHQQIALPETMQLDFFIVRPEERAAALLYLLENMVGKNKAIVFVSTRFHVDFLLSLVGELYECQGVYGKMGMEERTGAMECFRRKKRSILIVTDVAARGLDIPEVGFVIHYDYPANQQIFVHRSGRTARAEKKGHTLSLITYHELPYLAELSSFLNKKLVNQPSTNDAIHYGTIPPQAISQYVASVAKMKSQHPEIAKNQTLADKAFQKFKKCRSQASQASLKKVKTLPLNVHHMFAGTVEEEQQKFLDKIKHFTPKRSFLEMQKIAVNEEPQNDAFLKAVSKMRKEQENKGAEEEKKQKMREANNLKWKEVLDKQEIEEFQKYRTEKNTMRTPIQFVEGIDISIQQKPKKSQQKDFKNYNQYITTQKDPTVRTEFDDLPRIKNNQIDAMLQDENPRRKVQQKRVWDKTKKNFVWQKDQEDKPNKEEKGKKAYLKWKKKFKLSIPKPGEMEDQEQISRAKQNWKSRRRGRHGWKEAKQKGESRGLSLKNNKTKAIEKRFKKRLISKSKNQKGQGKQKRGKGHK